jgi:hypothetical protein
MKVNSNDLFNYIDVSICIQKYNFSVNPPSVARASALLFLSDGSTLESESRNFTISHNININPIHER